MKFEIDLSPALVRGLERMREAKGCSSIDEVVEMQLAWIKDYEPIDPELYMLSEEWAKREGMESSGIRARVMRGRIPFKRDEKNRIWIARSLTRSDLEDGRSTRWHNKRESK